MQTKIIQSYKGQLKIGTWDLSQGSKIQHRILKGIIERHPEHFEASIPKIKRKTNKKGGQIEEYLLSEDETRTLFAFMINHSNMKMGLHTCIFRHAVSETQFFKMLEEYFDEINELKEFEEW